jgi:hypothetical protein
MADGGILLADAGKQETAEELLARMNAKYGLGYSQPAAPTSPPQQAQPKPAPAQQQPAANTIQDTIANRNADLKNITNYASGGVALPKGKTVPIKGKGSGISDDIPAVVAGQRVRLSNGEGAAILPAKTMKNEAAVEAIESIIEATNGKPTVQREESAEMKRGGIRKCASGGIIDDKKKVGGTLSPSGMDTAYSDKSMYGNPLSGVGDALSDSAAAANTGIRFGDIRSARNEGGQQAVNQIVDQSAASRNMPNPTQSDIRKIESSPDFRASQIQAMHAVNGETPAAISAKNSITSVIPESTTTGNAGNAQFNASKGILS